MPDGVINVTIVINRALHFVYYVGQESTNRHAGILDGAQVSGVLPMSGEDLQ